MAIEISTYGTRDTDDAMKNSRFGDGANVVVNEVESKPEGDGKDAKENVKDEKAPTETKEEKEAVTDDGKDKKNEPPVKAKDKKDDDEPSDVPRARLNKEISRRKALEEEAEELRERVTRLEKAGKTPAAEPDDDDAPQTYSGKPEPKIEDYTGNPEKYPDPYAAFTKDSMQWAKEEAKAELRAEKESEALDRANLQRVEHFEATQAEIEKHYPDLKEVLASDEARTVKVTQIVVDAIRDSDVGPAVLRHLVLNPEIAAEWMKKPLQSQLVAFGRLETKIEAEIEAKKKESKASDKKETRDDKDDKKDDSPPAKTKSNAPQPPDRLKPSGDGKKSAREIAGGDEKHVVIISANLSEYEQKRRQQGYQP